jgi:diaminopimelate epimerase
MEFFKYHGAGNDFILMNSIGDKSPVELSKDLCHRRFGIGADGLMYPEPSDIADIKMLYYNSDGSFATMCGNGLRCFSKFLYEENIVAKTEFSVETGDGIKEVSLVLEENDVTAVKVKMHEGAIPRSKHAFEIDEASYKGAFLHLGVPHLVLKVETIDEKKLRKHGPQMEKAANFENGTNVNFVRVVDREHIKVDTWERGAGYTYACGTGCCASVYALYKEGIIEAGVTVTTLGGQLFIEVLENDVVMMTGPAIKICKGNYLAPLRG